MTSDEFVDAIRKVVVDAAVTGTIEIAQSPPGRRPSPDLVEVSGWFKSLGASDKSMVQRMLQMTAHASVFGFLAVLDGSRAVVDYAGIDDYFELRHVHGTEVDVLSGPNGVVLHERL